MQKAFLFIIGTILFSCSFFYPAQSSEIEEKDRAIREALLVASAAQPKILKIGLVDCIAYALKNNSEIKIEKIEPLISEQDIKIAEADFDPTVNVDSSLEDSKVEPSSTLAASHTRTGKFNFGIDGKLSLGTEYNIDFLNNRYRDDTGRLAFNPYYQSEYALTITQPLFRDFGTSVNRADITIANNNLEKSNQNLKEELIDVISQVEEAYYSYVLYIEKYKTARVFLQRAKDLLEIIQKRQQKGLASSLDLLEAKTGVAEREDTLLGIEKALKLAEDNLKYVTNIIDEVELWNAHIEPLDKPEFKRGPLDLVESLKIAFECRPDYEAAKIELNNQNIRILLKKNAKLPAVDLVGSVSLNGLDKDYATALKADGKEWSTGLKISWPWGNKEAKGDYEKANLTKRQLLISFDRLQQTIILEVRDAVRGVNIAGQKVATAQKREDTETQRYKAIEQRFSQGLVSAHDMLEYQEDLSQAETGYIQSLIDYSESLINLDKTIGLTLAKNDIKLEEK